MSLAYQKKREMCSSSQNPPTQSFLQLASQLQSAAGLSSSVPHQRYFQQRNINSREGSLSKDKSTASSSNFKNMSTQNYHQKKQKSFEIIPSSARHDQLQKGRINRQNTNNMSGEHTCISSDIAQSQRSIRNHALTEPDQQCEELFNYDVSHLNQSKNSTTQKSPTYIQHFHKQIAAPMNQIRVLTPNLNKQNAIKTTNLHNSLQKKGYSAVVGSSKENKCLIIPSNTSELHVSKKNKKELTIENPIMKTEGVPQKHVILDENNNCYDERHNFNESMIRYAEELAKQQSDYQQLYSIYIQEKNQREELEQTISQLYSEISRYRAETEATICDVYEIALLARGLEEEEQQQHNHQEKVHRLYSSAIADKTCQLMSKLHPLVLELGIAGALAIFGEEFKIKLEAQLQQQYISEERINKQGSLLEIKQSQEISCQYSQDGSPSASHRSSSQFSKGERQTIPQNDKISFNFLKDGQQHSLANYAQNHFPTIQDQMNIPECLLQKHQDPSIFAEHSEIHSTGQVNNSSTTQIIQPRQNLVLPRQMHQVLSKTCVSELISPSAAFSKSGSLSQERNQALKILKQPQQYQATQDNQSFQRNQQEYVGEDSHELSNQNGINKEDGIQTKIKLIQRQETVESLRVNETTVDGSTLISDKMCNSNNNLLPKQLSQPFENDQLALKRDDNVNTATQDQEIYFMELSSYFSSEKSSASQNLQGKPGQEERFNHLNMSSKSLIQTKHLNQNSIHYQEKNLINLRNVSAEEETTLEESREDVSSGRGEVEPVEIIPAIFSTQNTQEHCETNEDYAIAVFDFKAQKENDLEFQKGDKINVLKRIENGWWIGLCRDKIGYFPCNFIKQSFQ